MFGKKKLSKTNRLPKSQLTFFKFVLKFKLFKLFFKKTLNCFKIYLDLICSRKVFHLIVISVLDDPVETVNSPCVHSAQVTHVVWNGQREGWQGALVEPECLDLRWGVLIPLTVRFHFEHVDVSWGQLVPC